jgi:two-component sensor histidine kinase
LHARRVTSAEDGRRALLDARQRLDVMSRIHRRLTTPLAKGDDLAHMIEEVCRDLLAATGATNIVCRVDMAAVDLPLDRVSALALIVTELFTNALKHAFIGRPGGTIAVTLQPTATGHYVLEVRDDGIGLQRAPDPPEPRPAGAMQGMGTRVIESLARRLDGRFSLSAGLCGEPGTVARLEFVA